MRFHFTFLHITPLTVLSEQQATPCSSLLSIRKRFHLRIVLLHEMQSKESKAIPVISRGGLYGCEMLRVPHCLDSWLTDGGEVVSGTLLPTNIFISLSGMLFK
jgi:hypothetical protein